MFLERSTDISSKTFQNARIYHYSRVTLSVSSYHTFTTVRLYECCLLYENESVMFVFLQLRLRSHIKLLRSLLGFRFQRAFHSTVVFFDAQVCLKFWAPIELRWTASIRLVTLQAPTTFVIQNSIQRVCLRYNHFRMTAGYFGLFHFTKHRKPLAFDTLFLVTELSLSQRCINN